LTCDHCKTVCLQNGNSEQALIDSSMQRLQPVVRKRHTSQLFFGFRVLLVRNTMRQNCNGPPPAFPAPSSSHLVSSWDFLWRALFLPRSQVSMSLELSSHVIVSRSTVSPLQSSLSLSFASTRSIRARWRLVSRRHPCCAFARSVALSNLVPGIKFFDEEVVLYNMSASPSPSRLAHT
jgi:hypothetical protein